MAKELALSVYRDPYTDWGQTHREKAQWAVDWFAKLGRRTHLRGFHYWLEALGDVTKPNGEPYLNTQKDWEFLLEACLQARYMEIGDWGNLLDRKHPKPIDHADYAEWTPEADSDGLVDTQSVAEAVRDSVARLIIDRILRNTPQYNANGFQTYTVAVYCEKNTMNDYIAPITQRYEAIFQPLIGESSIQRVEDIIYRIAQIGKPGRIFYISDFDPSGKQMPVSVARKAEFYAKEVYGADIKLIPLALTYEQVKEYKLPGVPTKAKDSRAAGFVAKYGDRATELDALEALHPGVLARMIEDAIAPYYDSERPKLVKAENKRIKERAEKLVADLRAKLEKELTIKLPEGLEEIDLGRALNDKFSVPKPEHEVDDDDMDWLLDTDRNYDDQLDAYKQFKEER